MAEERDFLIGLAPKQDARITIRQAGQDAFRNGFFLDACDIAEVNRALIEMDRATKAERAWEVFHTKSQFFSRKNAERWAEHIGSIVTPIQKFMR